MAPPPPELAGVEHEICDLSTGVRAHVATAGAPAAPALVMLHGWPQHWWCWRRLVPLLAGDFRLLMPDLRGLGWSGQPADGDYRKDRLAEDAVALLDAHGIERAGVIGHDWGGWAAFLTALRFPERLTGVLAMSIPHPWQPPTRLVRNAHRMAYQLPLAAPVLGPRLIADTPVVAKIMRMAWGDRSTFDPGEIATFEACYRDPERARASSRYYRDFLLRELPAALTGGARARRLRVPARLLYGTREPLGTAFAEGLERHGDDARAELLEGCGHFIPEERPAQAAAAARVLFAST